MYAIIEDTYTELANDYIVTEGEAKEIADSLNKKCNYTGRYCKIYGTG